MKILPEFTAVGILLSTALIAGTCSSFAEIETVNTLTALEGNVDVAWTNCEMAKIMPAGVGYDNDLGVFAYASGFSSNFINSLVPETNGSVASCFVRVCETNAATRYRYYYNRADECVHTTDVSILGYPENWIEDVYGEPPAWLSGSSLDEWYDQRDPSRQGICCILIATNDIADYLARMTNAVPPWEEGGTNRTLLDLYSNKIAFVQIETDSQGVELYVHAPTNVGVLDVYRSTNLLVSDGWTLPATLDFTTDPLLWRCSGSESNSFFMAADPTVDTDGDGLGDAREMRLFGTSVSLRDSDGDGIDDGTEIMQYGLSAGSMDSDGDGIADADEIAMGTNPNSADSDGDGLTDYAEIYTYYSHTDPLDPDSDNDGLNDYAEIVTYGTYALEADTDSDGVNLSDYAEVNTYSTDPKLADTDNDGMHDWYEIYMGWSTTNPTNASEDADSDGFDNLTEYQWWTNPKEYDDKVPDDQLLITRGPGVNAIRTADTINFVLAVGDCGTTSSIIRIRPFRQGTNAVPVEQRLHHTQSSGIYINGTEASSLSTPIVVAASSNATEYKITADAGAAGGNIYFELKDTNGVKQGLCCSARFYVPKVTSVEFSQAKVCNYANAGYGETTNLWISMPDDTNDCRIYMYAYQSPGQGYGIPYFRETDWVCVKVTGDGSDPADTSLNRLDYLSAEGRWNNDKYTRGIRLAPGSHTVQVGFDMSGNGALESGEVQETCRIYAPRVDIDVDSNNDGSTTEADETIENVLPGKLIFADKDAYWRDGVTNSQVIAVDLDFDMGGSTVPSNAYVVLEWCDSFSALSCVAVYEDAACISELSRTYVYDPDGYDIVSGLGHVYGPGDTVPNVVYVRASVLAFKPDGDDTKTVVDDTISLVCHRLDTEAEVCRDDVKVSICNTPAVSPKGKTLYIWEEEQTDSDTHDSTVTFEHALKDDLAGYGLHANPYPVEYFQTSSNTTSAAAFGALGNGSIVLTVTHGDDGYVMPVAFPRTWEGMTNAYAWAEALGTNWAEAVESPPAPNGYDCWWVEVKTSYFQSEWKTQRDANNGMVFALCCYGAVSNTAESLPSYIESVGGSFAVGCTNPITTSDGVATYVSLVKAMRQAKWRTAQGAFELKGIDIYGYRTAGVGKVTLWPAPLEGSQVACYPKEHCEEGIALVVFDTGLHNEVNALKKLSGDADMTGSTPAWLTYCGTNCGLRWSYTKDTSKAVKTLMRARKDRCYTSWTGVEFTGKKLAADGESCGSDLDWEF